MPSLDQLRDQRVRRIIRAALPIGAGVLEVSCGTATLLAQLRADGFDARGTNFTAYPAAAPSVPVDNGVNAIAGLPYADARFDCVVFLDVIEHLHDHQAAIRHAARVLKPGGILIIASPNICNISSRFHFLATGFFKVRRSFIGFDLPIDRSFAFHNHPPHLPVLLYQMNGLGVPMETITAVGWKLKSVLFYALLLPILLPWTFHRTMRQEKFLAGTAAGRTLARALTSAACCIGEAMIVVGRRAGTAAAGRASAPSVTYMPVWYQGDGAPATPAAAHHPPGGP